MQGSPSAMKTATEVLRESLHTDPQLRAMMGTALEWHDDTLAADIQAELDRREKERR